MWRIERGMSQKDLAAAAGLKQSQIARIESGEIALTSDKAFLLARKLDVWPSDLFPDAPITVPLVYRVAVAPEGGAVAAAPFERVAASARLTDPQKCIAAEIMDNSADRLFPAGTLLFIRPRAEFDGHFVNGDRVLVAEFVKSRVDGRIRRVLVGELTQSLLGDLVVYLRSSNRAVPAAIYVRQGTSAPEGFSEQGIAYRPEHIVYEPRDDDGAEIIGRVEAVAMPVLNSLSAA